MDRFVLEDFLLEIALPILAEAAASIFFVGVIVLLAGLRTGAI